MSYFPSGASGEESACQCRRRKRRGFSRSLGWEDPLEKEWLPTPVFFPGKFHGQRSLVSYSPWGCKGSDTTEWLLFSNCLTTSFLSNPGTKEKELLLVFVCLFCFLPFFFSLSYSNSESLIPNLYIKLTNKNTYLWLKFSSIFPSSELC